jgi:hypothetical protein
MATLWITALAKDQARIQALGQHLKRYGLEVAGHFWIDDLEKFAWMDVAEEMFKSKASAWLVLPADEELAKPAVRYGLNALAAVVNARAGREFPTAWWGAQDNDAVPTLLRGAVKLGEATPAWQAKLVALAHKSAKGAAAPYRIGMHANAQFGQWFEIGPVEGTWQGVMFGIHGGSIDFHAVGPKGELPQKTVLEFAQKDMKVAVGDKEFLAWACQNTLDPGHSYYVRVKGMPETVLFCPLASGDDTEAFVLRLA